MNSPRGLLSVLVGTILSYAVMELYMALRPPDLSEQISEYLSTAKGRFDVWYAERERRQPDWPRSED